MPFHRIRREGYKYQKQMPSEHVENLNRCLRIAPFLAPRYVPLDHFCIRHPDLRPGNIIVSRTPGSEVHITSVIDWQYTSILPLFLFADIPEEIENIEDTASRYAERPSQPENLDSMDADKRGSEMERYRRRLVHYHYVKGTEKYNEIHNAPLTDP